MKSSFFILSLLLLQGSCDNILNPFARWFGGGQQPSETRQSTAYHFGNAAGGLLALPAVGLKLGGRLLQGGISGLGDAARLGLEAITGSGAQDRGSGAQVASNLGLTQGYLLGLGANNPQGFQFADNNNNAGLGRIQIGIPNVNNQQNYALDQRYQLGLGLGANGNAAYQQGNGVDTRYLLNQYQISSGQDNNNGYRLGFGFPGANNAQSNAASYSLAQGYQSGLGVGSNNVDSGTAQGYQLNLGLGLPSSINEQIANKINSNYALSMGLGSTGGSNGDEAVSFDSNSAQSYQFGLGLGSNANNNAGSSQGYQLSVGLGNEQGNGNMASGISQDYQLGLDLGSNVEGQGGANLNTGSSQGYQVSIDVGLPSSNSGSSLTNSEAGMAFATNIAALNSQLSGAQVDGNTDAVQITLPNSSGSVDAALNLQIGSGGNGVENSGQASSGSVFTSMASKTESAATGGSGGISLGVQLLPSASANFESNAASGVGQVIGSANVGNGQVGFDSISSRGASLGLQLQGNGGAASTSGSGGNLVFTNGASSTQSQGSSSTAGGSGISLELQLLPSGDAKVESKTATSSAGSVQASATSSGGSGGLFGIQILPGLDGKAESKTTASAKGTGLFGGILGTAANFGSHIAKTAGDTLHGAADGLGKAASDLNN